MCTNPDALWHIRGVQFIYPGAYIRITQPFDRSFNLTTSCYTKSKWTTFKRQYNAAGVLAAARHAVTDVDGTAAFTNTFDPTVPRLSGKGGCLIGVTFMTSPNRGTHMSLYFRATEFTWRHTVDFIFFTRLLELVPELPKPITVHLHYHKLFLNTLFLPMLIVPLGKKPFFKLMNMSYERLRRPWKRHWNWFTSPDTDTSDEEKSCKLKATRRAMMWTRGEIKHPMFDWDNLLIP